MLLQLTESHHRFSFPKSPAQENYLESLVTALWALGLHQPVMVSIKPAGSAGPEPEPSLVSQALRGHLAGQRRSCCRGPEPCPAGPGRSRQPRGGDGDCAGVTVRRCRGRRFLPPPGRAGPVPPSRVGEGGTGTHLAPSGTGPGCSRLPGAGRGPRPARARSPRRSLRCQQTSRHFLRPRRKRHRVLPRKHRRGRNARSAGTRRGRGRSVTSQGPDATRRRD